jgi:hypothetical protein
MRLRCVLATLVVLGVLGGCSDDDPEPKISDPTPSVSSEPTESETVSASPTMSPTNSSDPVETVKSWIDAQNLALSTGDTAPLRALAAKDCRGCSDFPDGIDEIINAGGHFEGGQWKLVRAKVDEPSARPLRVNVAVRIAGGATVTQSGAEPNTYEATSRLFAFELDDSSGTWLISLIGSLS